MKLLGGLIFSGALLLAIAIGVAEGLKVTVLPIDGNADPALRAKLDQSLQTLAHDLPGTVAVGTTTMADDAIALGCDPAQTSCVDSVMGTLGVDELVWGTATTTDGQTTLVVKRATKGTPPQVQTVTLAPGEGPDKAEAALKPLFTGEAVGSGSALGSAGSGSALGSAIGSGSAAPGPVHWSNERKLGVGLAAGGGLALVIGFAFWAEAGSYQDQINTGSDNSYQQIQALKDLESTGSTYAIAGDVLFVVGLAAGGIGAYYLWKDHEASHVMVAPTVEPAGGMGLVVGGHW